MNVTEILNSGGKYEGRFRRLEDYLLDPPIDRMMVDVVNHDIARLKYNMNHGYLRGVIKNERRKISENYIDGIVSKLQDYRNEHYNSDVKDIGLDISSIVDSKKRWKNRLNEIYDKVDSINGKISQNDMDELRYTLYCIEKNNYLNSRSELEHLRKKVEKKLRRKIRRSRKTTIFLI